MEFNTLSGMLTVVRKGNLYEMDFPTYELKEIPVTDAMEAAFGSRPIKAVLGLDLICVFENEEIIRNMNPDQSLLMNLALIEKYRIMPSERGNHMSKMKAPKIALLTLH